MHEGGQHIEKTQAFSGSIARDRSGVILQTRIPAPQHERFTVLRLG